MTQQIINLGTAADADGDTVHTVLSKCQSYPGKPDASARPSNGLVFL
jgi:hypothetical protein